MPIHYSEGAFPLTLYANNYRDNYKLKHECSNCCEDMCGANIHETIKRNKSHIKALMVTDISVKKNMSLSLSISYSDGSKETYKLEPGNKYRIKYSENGELITVVGIIKSIGQVNTSPNVCNCTCCTDNDYIISVDSSTEYNSQVVNIRSSHIRGLSPYIQFGDEDTDIMSGTASGSTVAGEITDITIVNAVVDEKGIITSGEISKGTLVPTKVMIANSCVTGLNVNGHKITVRDSDIDGGTVIKGKIISGKLEDFVLPKDKPADGKYAVITAKSGTMVIDLSLIHI